jgi:hypothetical protein
MEPRADNLQTQLWPIYRVWVSLVDLYAGDKANARIFINSLNWHLENRAPVAFIEKRGTFKPFILEVCSPAGNLPSEAVLGYRSLSESQEIVSMNTTKATYEPR